MTDILKNDKLNYNVFKQERDYNNKFNYSDVLPWNHPQNIKTAIIDFKLDSLNNSIERLENKILHTEDLAKRAIYKHQLFNTIKRKQDLIKEL